MASENKKKKLKNSYCWGGALKIKSPNRLKRILFFTPSERKRVKDETSREVENV